MATVGELLKGRKSATLGKIVHPALREGQCTVRLVFNNGYSDSYNIVLKDSQGQNSYRWGISGHESEFSLDNIIAWLNA